MSHSISTLLMVVCSPPVNSRTFPGSVNAQAVRPRAIFSCSSSLVLRAAQTGNHPVWEDSVRSQKSTHSGTKFSRQQGMLRLISMHHWRGDKQALVLQGINTVLHTHTHTPTIHTHTHTHTPIHVCICTYVSYTHTHLYYICKYMTCIMYDTHVHIYLCVYLYAHVFVCMHMYICICLNMYVYVYKYIYRHIFT